jgi:spermidine/putrescine transport system permease protein
MRRAGQYLFFSLMITVLLFIFAPIITIIIFSFNVDKFASLPWKGFTIAWYDKLLSDPNILQALNNSVIVASSVALSSCVLGFLGAYALYRRPFKFQNVYLALMISPLAVPWIILGLALAVFLTTMDMEGSLVSVWISHTVFAAPFAMLIIRARMSGLDSRFEEAGWDLGANRLKAIWHIVIPLTLPGIIAAFLLTFTISFDEVIIAWFVCGFEETLPVKIYGMIRSGINPTINAIGSIIFVFTMTLAVLAQMLIRDRKR